MRQTDLYEQPVQRTTRALTAAGCDVEVIMMRHPERPRRTTVDGVSLTSLPTGLGRSGPVRYVLDYALFFGLVTWILAVRHLRRPYTVVQINTMPDFLVFAGIVPKLLGARLFVFMNEPMPELAATLYGPGLVPRVLAAIERRAVSFADHAYTVTDELKRRYVEQGASGERVTVVLNGADPDARFEGWAPSANGTVKRFTIICHGTIEDRMGQDTIVEAVAHLHEELPDLRLVLTGRGSGVEHVLRRIEDHGLQDVATFEGFVPHDRLNDLLHAADLGVVAQKATPYSHLVQTNKMVDYWLFGLPVVASRLRAVSSMFDDRTLEYFNPGDPRDLARAIRHLYEDPHRRGELVRNGHLALERHGWRKQREAYLAPYAATGALPAASNSDVTVTASHLTSCVARPFD